MKLSPEDRLQVENGLLIARDHPREVAEKVDLRRYTDHNPNPDAATIRGTWVNVGRVLVVARSRGSVHLVAVWSRRAQLEKATEQRGVSNPTISFICTGRNAKPTRLSATRI